MRAFGLGGKSAKGATAAPAAKKDTPAPPPAPSAATPAARAGGAAAAGAASVARAAAPQKADAFSPEHVAASYAEPLPAFRDVSVAERQALFAKKLHLCSFTFDFSDPARNAREKDMKRQTLMELVEYVNTGPGKFTEALFDDIAVMLSANLFRALPPCGHETTGVSAGEAFDVEEEEPALEPAWPHLQARAGGTALSSVSRLTVSRSPDCLRVSAALCRVQRHGRKGGEEVRGLHVRAAPARPV
jgi:Protein phosphatase 2A regulatory B subunit (B56 family)